MNWMTPLAFLLLIPLGVVAFFWLIHRRKKTSSFLWSSSHLLKGLPRGMKSRMIHFPIFLIVVVLVLVVIALARPRSAEDQIKQSVEGIDIIVALDISDSMLIEDMEPKNRLEASKKVIKEFIEQRTTDRIGLVVFAGESYTRVPLTLDQKVLQSNLASVKTTRSVKMGTAIGVALANATARLKESDAKSRVVIFLTDGENNTGVIPPETALEIAKGYQIKVYSIGMGRDGQAQLPYFVTLPNGRRIKRYRPLHSKINEPLLRRMAKETDGKFFRAITSQALKGVFNEIDQLEKSKIESYSYEKYEELFMNPLRWAALLYLLALVLEATWLRRIGQ